MLVNLTNHPSNLWPAGQKKAAEKYGGITDLPFPKIPSEWDKQDIKVLVNKYSREILELKQETREKIFVHLMGESTFMFALGHLLINNGITCIVSTTERNTDEEHELKLSRFRFVKFRELFIP
ncbi:MAG: hypothetical protein K9J25_04080 [Bacteroidales bacterium]|nr:hypothetical protein [Bacteroidales bacterium]